MKSLYIVDEIRTNNFSDIDIIKKIKRLWMNAMDKIDDDVNLIKYAVYYDYEKDYRKDYTMAIVLDEYEDGREIKISDKYIVYKVDTQRDNAIYKAWKEIWELDCRGEIKRAYLVDFEKYYPDERIEIYISV